VLPPFVAKQAYACIKAISKKKDDQSAKSGRTMKQIAAERDAEWQSNRTDDARSSFKARIKSIVETPKAKKKSQKPVNDAKSRATGPSSAKPGGGLRARRSDEPSLPGSLSKAKPQFIEPMKPRLVETPPAGGDWMYELKFDGIRALAVHAKDDQAKRYYEQFDFVSSPTDPLHLFVLLKDLRKLVLSASNTRSPK